MELLIIDKAFKLGFFSSLNLARIVPFAEKLLISRRMHAVVIAGRWSMLTLTCLDYLKAFTFVYT